MKINTKKELEKIESKLMSLKENERMARFKTEQIKGLEMELKELESELELELKYEESIFKNRGLNCEMNNIQVSKSYYSK